MPSESSVPLPFALSSIALSGPDAIPFLQSQLTADIEALVPGRWTPAAWCNPKGRTLAVLCLCLDGDVVQLALPEVLAESTMKRLNLYRIGRNVTMSASSSLTPNDLEALRLEGADMPNDRLHRWFLDQIERGMPWLVTETADQFLPQMLGLERIGGLSYRKGCYPGQEVIARVHYRGRLTRRLARFESAGAPPAPGATFTLGAGEGTVLYAVPSIEQDSTSTGLMVVPADAHADHRTNGFRDEPALTWSLFDPDPAVLPSGA